MSSEEKFLKEWSGLKYDGVMQYNRTDMIQFAKDYHTAQLQHPDLSEDEILSLLDERLNLLETDEKNERIDLIELHITDTIKDNYSKYSVDFILETLTKFGQAPNLIYDDNGLFAVSSIGFQPVVYGDQRLEGSVSIAVEKDQWFDTVRKALWYYLNN